MNDHRAEASDRVDASFSIECHGFAGLCAATLGIFFVSVFVLYCLHPRLQALQLLHLVGLSNRQRNHENAHDNGEGDNAETVVEEEVVVEQGKRVDHGSHDALVPDEAEEFH